MDGRCLENPPKFFIAAAYKVSVREQLQCYINALGEASTMNGMTNEWKAYEPEFQQHLDAWKQCDSADDKSEKFLYVLQQKNFVDHS